MPYRFYTCCSRSSHNSSARLADGYTAHYWRPGLLRIRPGSLPTFPFGVWWLLHITRLFANRDYGLLLIEKNGELVHRSCVYPRYFRFPFMSADDLQIGDTWTDERHRGRGLASYAIAEILRQEGNFSRRYWYVVDCDNAASIRAAEKAGFQLFGRGEKRPRWGVRLFGSYQLESLAQPQRSASGTNLPPTVHQTHARSDESVIKRAFDLLASAVGFVSFAPLLAAIALWIKFDSPGPAFYRGKRAGKDGRPFEIFKFRSMVANAEAAGGPTTSANDARVTRSGRFIRRFKLDELSQLINVLRGDMSLVGPRPEVLPKVEVYSSEERRVLSVRPGITDWASIWNADEGGLLAGAPDPDFAYERVIRPWKIKLQLHYVETRTFWTDLRLIMYTLLKIVRRSWIPAELRGYPTFEALREQVLALIARDERNAAA